MALESKIKNQIVVKQFVNEYNGYRINLGDILFDENGKIYRIDRGEVYDENNIQIGNFSVYGTKNEYVDNRIFNTNINFNKLELINVIIESIENININNYEYVEEFEYERRAREASENMAGIEFVYEEPTQSTPESEETETGAITEPTQSTSKKKTT